MSRKLDMDNLTADDLEYMRQRDIAAPDNVVTPSTEDDDYDDWKGAELLAEARKRAEDPELTIAGSGKNGATLKSDVIKWLRQWDADHAE